MRPSFSRIKKAALRLPFFMKSRAENKQKTKAKDRAEQKAAACALPFLCCAYGWFGHGRNAVKNGNLCHSGACASFHSVPYPDPVGHQQPPQQTPGNRAKTTIINNNIHTVMPNKAAGAILKCEWYGCTTNIILMQHRPFMGLVFLAGFAV